MKGGKFKIENGKMRKRREKTNKLYLPSFFLIFSKLYIIFKKIYEHTLKSLGVSIIL